MGRKAVAKNEAQASSNKFPRSSGPEDFKKYEFVNVDHPNIKKSIKLDSRLDIYDGQANGGIRLANYICALPEGGELVAFMYLAERCRNFCAFLLPATWINPTEAGMPQRARWGKKCLEKKAYILKASVGKQWMIVVNSQRKGEKLFAKAACVERAGSAKEVHVYEKCMKDAEETQE
ncbi:hypothetical protein CYMTET_42519 [Cymbomonas tetramitiformis]|uniref:Uncharacterized protein n=1 Tax=Cymbomonas tetramitiformis TaxID=36881 RepID=A0AAE0C5P6_9CHLO|nr:hypothetical protein CYMTET_42519 [Cymbomonas tetramitiformis]